MLRRPFLGGGPFPPGSALGKRDGSLVQEPRYVSHASLLALRGARGLRAHLDGLWCAGTPEALRRPSVAVVGTRSATPYGRRLATSFARELAKAGCCIVSGLALGIDGCAHEGALEAGEPTIGVLGSGHRHFFPPRNLPLARRMLEGGGAVLSPFPPDQAAKPGQFLQRNGVVAALCDAVLVVEAPARSGALNTAGWAAGRVPVLAVPGDVDRRHSAGCLALIRDGATLARTPGDVLEALGLGASAPALAQPERNATPLARRILALLDSGECALDDIVEGCDAPTPDVLAALTMLELDGRIACRGPARYARR
ncbi:MAG TPA: DNA-processing protein DprA [Candidatus Dormibacteraeota bacterium]|nr:DNA-processing protein DprA [Candidatus Dormibacteraeota bacterium]